MVRLTLFSGDVTNVCNLGSSTIITCTSPTPLHLGQFRIGVFNPDAIGVPGQFDIFDLTVPAAGATAAAFDLVQGSGPPTAADNQGTLYWNNVDFSLWEYTGVGRTTTTTMIATGNDPAATFTSVSPNFTILPGSPNIGQGQFQAPPPATTPFQVVFAARNRTLFVANSNLVWQFLGTIVP